MKNEIRKLLDTLTFGIEIECTNLDKVSISSLFGSTMSKTHSDCDKSGFASVSVNGKAWRFEHDNSIGRYLDSYEDFVTEETTECITPPLKLTEFEQVITLCDCINSLRGKSFAQFDAGVHIHIGYKHGFTSTALRHLWRDVAAHQGLLFQIAETSYNRQVKWARKFNRRYLKGFNAEWRIGEYWYGMEHDTYSLSKKDTDRAIIDRFKEKKYDNTRYHLLNFHSFFRQRTVEFRPFELKGSIDATKLFVWVKLAMLITAKAILAENSSLNMPNAFACGNSRYAARKWLESMGCPSLYYDLDLDNILEGDAENRFGEGGDRYRKRIIKSII